MIENEYIKYRCSACKKKVKNTVGQCKSCVKLFHHPGLCKHKVYKGAELMKCGGPFREIVVESYRSLSFYQTEMKKTSVTSRGRLGSVGDVEATRSTTGSGNKQTIVNVKIDWLVRKIKEIKNEVACKNEIKTMIRQIIQKKMDVFKQEWEDRKKVVRKKYTKDNGRSYSQVVKGSTTKSILIVKPKKDQESEITKQVVKEKVDIKNLTVGITKLRKEGKDLIIFGRESEG